MKKILLLIPPVTVKREEYVPRNCYPCLGVGYIAAVLEKAGHSVNVLDAFTTKDDNIVLLDKNATYGLDDISIKARIQEFNPDIVGIASMYTMYAQDAHRMAKIKVEQC